MSWIWSVPTGHYCQLSPCQPKTLHCVVVGVSAEGAGGKDLARDIREVRWHDHKISFFQDFSRVAQEGQHTFLECKPILHTGQSRCTLQSDLGEIIWFMLQSWSPSYERHLYEHYDTEAGDVFMFILPPPSSYLTLLANHFIFRIVLTIQVVFIVWG